MYQAAIAQTSDAEVRQLLGDLAAEESKHYDLAEKMGEKQLVFVVDMHWKDLRATGYIQAS